VTTASVFSIKHSYGGNGKMDYKSDFTENTVRFAMLSINLCGI